MAYKECERRHDEREAEENGGGCRCDTGYCLFCESGCSGPQD